jgi:hypothetical protein
MSLKRVIEPQKSLVFTSYLTSLRVVTLSMWRWGELVTNKFLSEIFLDPGSLVRRLTSLRLSTPHESKAVCFLHLHK